MAYRRKTSRRASYSRGRVSTGRSRTYKRSTRRVAARRSSGSARTIRIVIEQPSSSAVARPPLGQKPATVKTRVF